MLKLTYESNILSLSLIHYAGSLCFVEDYQQLDLIMRLCLQMFLRIKSIYCYCNILYKLFNLL